MKKLFIPSMLVAFAMICSCQKHDSAAEQQVTQRKTDLDAREQGLVEREQALNERQQVLDGREKALAEKERATANARTIAPSVQGQISDPAQVNAERDRRIEQLPPEVRALVPDPSQVNSIKLEKKAEATRTGLQGQSSDAAQLKAEQQKRIEQLPPEVRALIPDPAQMNSMRRGSVSPIPSPTSP